MLTTEGDADEAELLERHGAMTAAVDARPKLANTPALVKEQGRWGLKEAAKRADLQNAFRGADWRLAAVDLSKVLAFQKTVRLPGLDERILEAKEDPKALLELCLPSEEPEVPLVWAPDADGKGYTLSSFNPNFRVYEVMPGTATVPSMPGSEPINRNAIFVTYGAPPSYLQVASYRGRFFLRDGYHRAVALLRAGVNEVPCVLVKATNLSQVFTAAGNFLTEDVMMGERPPFVKDFVDDNVSADGDMIEIRRVIRIRGDEFVLPS